jgi:hypothetical protein
VANVHIHAEALVPPLVVNFHLGKFNSAVQAAITAGLQPGRRGRDAQMTNRGGIHCPRRAFPRSADNIDPIPSGRGCRKPEPVERCGPFT